MVDLNLPIVVLLSFILFLNSLNRVTTIHTCRDEFNNSIDWFVIYKIPILSNHSNPLIRTGVAYAYLTSKHEADWILSDKSINDTNSMAGLTLAPLYPNKSTTGKEMSQDLLYTLYNDQPPVGNVSFTGGHTKGVVLAADKGGLWLVHSVPHYPPVPQAEQYHYPKTGLKNGQSYLCITLLPDQMDIVGTQLMYNYPHIYASATAAALTTLYPVLTRAAKGDEVLSPPWYHAQSLTSAAGTNFHTFAKSPQFKKELYSDWVAASLQVTLLVETWPNGRGHLNSSCNLTYRVENIESVRVDVVGESFSSHKDHSKWAVSEMQEEPWVCIGDINRALTQEVRGGGTVCVRDRLLWRAYHGSVTSVEPCPTPTVLNQP